MCGIIGYIGKKQATPILLEGLRRLEYRGYDSAGVSVFDGKHIKCVKDVGRIDKLSQKLQGQPLTGTMGIGHTRWATHGFPNEINAHPHFDCEKKIHLIHNGIIENYKILKEQLIKEGHKFITATDTEVLAHLIEKFFKNQGEKKLEQAVQRALRLVAGAYALVVIAEQEPDKIVAARLGSPLRIGLGNGDYFVASDAAPLIAHTREMITLEDNEMAVLTSQGYHISSLKNNQAIEKEVEKIDWDLEEIEKGGFDHFMLKEIFEQPRVIKFALRGRLVPEEGLAHLGGLREVENELRQVKRIILLAMGTAWHAAKIAEYMLEEYAGIPAVACNASEFRYRKPLIEQGTAVIVLSQSGETADTIAGLREAKRKGALCLGVVNVVGSTVSRETDAGVYNHAGPEIGVASTKVFVSQLAVLTLITLLLARQRDMSLVRGRNIAMALQELPGQVEKILEQAEKIKTIAEKYNQYENFIFMGRKYNYPIALEGALKLKEISYVHAEGFPAGELKHGPIAMINPRFPTFAIALQDSVYEKNISNIEEIRARQGKVIAVATEGDEDIKEHVDEVIYIPKTLEMLSPILSVVPAQLFAYYFAVKRGCDVDRPRNLAKSVTVE